MKHSAVCSLAALLGIARPLLAQDASTTTISATPTISALQETVTPEPSQTLLAFETTQLTDNVLEGLNETEIALFGFDNSTDIDDETTTAAASRLARRNGACKVFPGDALWPSNIVWSLFDLVLGGALLKPEPAARVCWGSTLNVAKCAALTANWTNSYAHMDDPIEVFNPEFQGMTCQPPFKQYPYITTCTQGGYPVYVVEATNVAQIQLAVNFARATGVRLVVKNTGHDFAGKSSGAGSLSIWTHNLKDMQYFASYSDGSGYRGPAVKAASGVQAFELYKFAKSKKVVAVGGEAQTVGVMGGYILGGGHSPLGSIYGMAADQVLAFEVVTPDGRFRTASSSQNADLYWALRGGGGGTFGVVTSVTLKVYPDVPCTSASFTFMPIGLITEDMFWAGVRAYVKRFPEFTAAGTYAYWFIYPNFATGVGNMFIMQPFFFPNMNLAQSQALLAPFLAEMAQIGIAVEPVYQSYSSFYEAWQTSFPLETVMNSHATTASRLIPKDNWSTDAKLNSTVAAIKTLAVSGKLVVGFHIEPKLHAGNSENAVNPAWRNALAHVIVINTWANATATEIKSNWNNFVTTEMNVLRDITPGSGSYLNEADRLEPNFQQSFYGSSYSRLLSIKNKYDPYDLFWVTTGVGSESWAVQTSNGLSTENGKLCRV